MLSKRTIPIFCVVLACITVLPIIVYNYAFAVPSSTGGGLSSKDRCFEGGLANVNLIRPHYAEIASQLTVTGTVVESHVSHEDVPFDHWSHDRVWHVDLDPRYDPLNTLSNEHIPGTHPTSTNPADKAMEMEWEIGITNDGGTERFPKEFWPSEGDRVWMMGRYIFDCGHPEKGPRTELHPPSAVAFTHFEPLVVPSAGSLPILAAKTSIYIHGEGGYYRTPVGGKHYEFDVILPPRPSPSSKLVWQVIDTPFGGRAPVITGPIAGGGIDYIHVDYDLTDVFSTSSSAKRGTHIAAGWTDPPQSNVYHQLKVTFNAITKNPVLNLRLQPIGDHTWEQLWASVNGQDVELLNPSTGFKRGDDPNRKVLSSKPSIITLIAEQGELGSALDISTTGWLRSGMDRECFGEFHTQDLSIGLDVAYLALHPACQQENTNPASLGSIDLQFVKTAPLVFGAHSDCSGENNLMKTKCEFVLEYDIQDVSGPIVVAGPPPTTQPPTPPTTQPPTPPTTQPPTPPTTQPPTPTPTPTSCDPNSPTLRIGKDKAVGSRGPKVTELQQHLTQLGYGSLLGPPGIDGKFGPYTESAVKRFQIDNKLRGKDGIAGPETWGAICKSLSSLTPTDMTKEIKSNYHRISLEQDTGSGVKSSSSSGEQELEVTLQESEELEDDWPAINFDALANLSESELIANSIIPSENATAIQQSNKTLAIVCSDGTTPDITTGQCADGSQPQTFNATTAGAAPLSQGMQSLTCADGSISDPSTGLCADGSQPQSQNASAIPVEQQQPLLCADGSISDPSTGLCVDGTQPQP